MTTKSKFLLFLFIFLGMHSTHIFSKTDIYKERSIDPDALYKKGKEYYQEGKYNIALSYFQKADDLIPGNPEYIEYIGLSAIKLNYYGTATAYLDEFAKYYDYDLITLKNLALVYSQLGKTDLAFEYIDLYLEGYPNSIPLLLNKGTLLWCTGEYEEGISLLRKINQEDPDYKIVLNNLATINLDAGRSDSAMIYFDKILELLPDDTNTLISKASILKEAGKKKSEYQFLVKKTIELESIVIKKNSRNYKSLKNRGYAYKMMGKKKKMLADFSRALDILNTLIDLHPESYMFLEQRAEIYDDLEDENKAIKDYERILEINPKYLPAIHYLEKQSK